MNVPKLNRAVTLETRDRTPDGAGGFVETWQPLGTLWAAIEPRRGGMRGTGDVTTSQTPADFIVRGAPVGSPSRPVPRQRFRAGTRVWRILAVTEADAQGRYLRCAAVEEVVP